MEKPEGHHLKKPGGTDQIQQTNKGATGGPCLPMGHGEDTSEVVLPKRHTLNLIMRKFLTNPN